MKCCEYLPLPDEYEDTDCFSVTVHDRPTDAFSRQDEEKLENTYNRIRAEFPNLAHFGERERAKLRRGRARRLRLRKFRAQLRVRMARRQRLSRNKRQLDTKEVHMLIRNKRRGRNSKVIPVGLFYFQPQTVQPPELLVKGVEKIP